jgi:hypothetical protein
LFAENECAWDIFVLLSTQLRSVGFGHLQGIDFTALPVIFDSKGVPHSERYFTIEKLAVLNSIAARHWNPKPKGKK